MSGIDLDVAPVLGRGAVPDPREAGRQRSRAGLTEAFSPRAQQADVTGAHDPAEHARGQRAVEPQARDRGVVAFGQRGVVARAGVDRAREQIAQHGQRLDARVAQALAIAQRRLGLVLGVVVVAHRQQHAHRSLQRAFEKAAQIGERQRGDRTAGRIGLRTQAQLPERWRDRGPGRGRERRAQRARLGKLDDTRRLAQRLTERDRLALAGGRRHHRAEGVVSMARERWVGSRDVLEQLLAVRAPSQHVRSASNVDDGSLRSPVSASRPMYDR